MTDVKQRAAKLACEEGRQGADAVSGAMTDWPTCPKCGYVHTDAWEWNFGPGLDGDAEHSCDRCEQDFHVERIVYVSYRTRISGEQT